MREIVLLRRLDDNEQNIARVASYSMGCEARIRVWEQMATKRGGMLWLIIRNLINPDGIKQEVIARYKAMSEQAPEKPKGNIEVKTVKTDEELQAELAKGNIA